MPPGIMPAGRGAAVSAYAAAASNKPSDSSASDTTKDSPAPPSRAEVMRHKGGDTSYDPTPVADEPKNDKPKDDKPKESDSSDAAPQSDAQDAAASPDPVKPKDDKPADSKPKSDAQDAAASDKSKSGKSDGANGAASSNDRAEFMQRKGVDASDNSSNNDKFANSKRQQNIDRLESDIKTIEDRNAKDPELKEMQDRQVGLQQLAAHVPAEDRAAALKAVEENQAKIDERSEKKKLDALKAELEKEKTLLQAARDAEAMGASKEAVDTLLNADFVAVNEQNLGSDAAAYRTADGKDVILISKDTVRDLREGDKQTKADVIALVKHENEHFDTARADNNANAQGKTYKALERLSFAREKALEHASLPGRQAIIEKFNERAAAIWNKYNEVHETTEQITELERMGVDVAPAVDPTTHGRGIPKTTTTVEIDNSAHQTAREINEAAYTDEEVQNRGASLLNWADAVHGALEKDGMLGPGGRYYGNTGKLFGPGGRYYGNTGEMMGPGGRYYGNTGLALGPGGRYYGNTGLALGPGGRYYGNTGQILGHGNRLTESPES